MTFTELVYSKVLPEDSNLAVLVVEASALLDRLCSSGHSDRLRHALANYLSTLPDKYTVVSKTMDTEE